MADLSDASLLLRLTAEWGLTPLAIERPAAGTMNDVWLVTTPERKVVLRGHRRSERWRVEFEHRVMDHVRERGVPVPAAVVHPSGQVVIERAKRFFSLLDCAAGHQVARDAVGRDHARAMGTMLGRIHGAFHELSQDGAPRATGRLPSQVLQRIDEILARIDARSDKQDQDMWAVQRLRSRVEWLRDAPDRRTAPTPRTQVVHGDYQESNVFFENGAVSAVIDWDTAEVRDPVEEIVRAMHLSLDLDTGRCRAFLDGYRSVLPVSVEELDGAASSYSGRRACDLWLYETIYLDGDDRPRRFLRPGTFTPFIDDWMKVRSELVPPSVEGRWGG